MGNGPSRKPVKILAMGDPDQVILETALYGGVYEIPPFIHPPALNGQH